MLLIDEMNVLEKIILIQRHLKMYLYLTKGPGYKNKELSKNVEDFYTLENINNIELKYLYLIKIKIKIYGVMI